MWYHVLESKDVEGTTSTLFDGFKIAEHIREQEPEYFALLSKVSYTYGINLNNEAIYSRRRKTFTVDDDNKVTAIHLNNIDRKPLDAKSLSEAKEALSCDNDDEAVTKLYAAMRYLHHLLLQDDRFSYKFDLQPGRMPLLDNHRMFHSRDAVTRGSRTVCGAYNGRSEWLNKLERLEEKYS